MFRVVIYPRVLQTVHTSPKVITVPDFFAIGNNYIRLRINMQARSFESAAGMTTFASLRTSLFLVKLEKVVPAT